MKSYNQRHGASILLTSHYMADITALCSRVLVIHAGQLIFDGYGTQYYTKIVVGSVLSIGLAIVLDFAFHRLEVALTPWARRRASA